MFTVVVLTNTVSILFFNTGFGVGSIWGKTFKARAFKAALCVIATLLAVSCLLRTLVNVLTGAQVTGQAVARGAGTFEAAGRVCAVHLTVVLLSALALINIKTLVVLAC